MKHLLTFLFLLSSMLGLSAANPSFTDLLQTNITWVAKNGNDSTAKISQPAKPFLTISNAVQATVAPGEVRVALGLYNESVILKNGVNLNMPSGVIVSQSVSTLPVFFDNGSDVTNSITGNVLAIHSSIGNANANGIQLTGNSDVLVDRMEVRSLGANGLYANNGLGNIPFLRYRGRVFCRGAGTAWYRGQLDFRGESYGTNDYGLIASSNGVSNYISGFFFSQLNSAVHIGGGFMMVESATCVSFDDSFGWGVEHSGGSGMIKNCLLMPSKQEAIGKYSGDLLIVDSSQLWAGTNCTYSIDNDGNGNHGSLEIRGPCWANKAPNPAMNILSGSVIVSNATTWKNPQVFKSVHDLTNVVVATNGTVQFPNTVTMQTNIVSGITHSTNGFASYSTLATNAVGATGYTNNQVINQTAYVTATAVAWTIKDRAQATLYVSPVLTATIPVNLQPGWSITAASGLVGTVLPW